MTYEKGSTSNEEEEEVKRILHAIVTRAFEVVMEKKKCSCCKHEFSLESYRVGNAPRSNCERCRDRQKKHYDNNKDKIKEKQRKYYANNTEKMKKTQKAYRTTNKEKIHESDKAYKERNRDEAKKDGKKWCSQCRRSKLLEEFDGEKSTCAACLEKMRKNITEYAKKTRKRAKKKGIPVEMSVEDFVKKMRKPCIYCNSLDNRGFNGLDRRDNSKGYTEENTDPCCWWCNYEKNTSDPVSFLKQRFHIIYYQRTGELRYPGVFGKPLSPTTLYSCKDSDKKKNRECTLIQEDLDWIRTQKCVFSGLPATSADRIDNNKAHTRDNIQPTIHACNIMRGNRTNEEFLAHGEKIIKHATEMGLLQKFKAMHIPRVREKKVRMNYQPSSSLL